MQNSRFATLLAIIVIFAIAAGTFFLGISPKLAEAAKADSDRETVEVQNLAHQAEVTRLIALNDRLPELEAELAEARTAVPASVDTSRLYRELEAIAVATGVRFTGISLNVPEPYVPAVEVESAAEPSIGVHPELTAALGSVNEHNFFTIAAQLGITGSYVQVLEALSQLQNNPRYVLVHGVTIEEGLPGGDAQVTANFDGQLFVLLDAADVVTPIEAAPVGAAPAK